MTLETYRRPPNVAILCVAAVAAGDLLLRHIQRTLTGVSELDTWLDGVRPADLEMMGDEQIEAVTFRANEAAEHVTRETARLSELTATWRAATWQTAQVRSKAPPPRLRPVTMRARVRSPRSCSVSRAVTTVSTPPSPEPPAPEPPACEAPRARRRESALRRGITARRSNVGARSRSASPLSPGLFA